MELSILIPARNEEFLSRTIDDALEHSEADTEILVGLDGAWADPVINDHPRVTLLHVSESIGQRAMTNQLARLSKAKYVMKVDAHCSFDQGFDRKMIQDMQDDITMVPVMRNLHAFDWVCNSCEERYYQGPTPGSGATKALKECVKCHKLDFRREIMWRAKRAPNSTSYRFDKTLHFQYWNEYKSKQVGDLMETLSLQGSCFMMTRDKYWDLEICDENSGSWGHQGSEVALKTWLSGGRVLCNRKTWYAHLFRTQGGDFSFPYANPESEIEKTRQYFRDIFLQDKWPKATRKLQWLIDKFSPVPDWSN